MLDGVDTLASFTESLRMIWEEDTRFGWVIFRDIDDGRFPRYEVHLLMEFDQWCVGEFQLPPRPEAPREFGGYKRKWWFDNPFLAVMWTHEWLNSTKDFPVWGFAQFWNGSNRYTLEQVMLEQPRP